MNMLRDEENAKYRSYLKKTVEFDPDILKRYVNFMSNPDERTAIDQFGSGDKYFGVCVLLATLPGLPMFGHGQIEGYTERYGMDFKQARLDEHQNDGLIARHQQLIAPLLKSRHIFAESTNFVLYDFWTGSGSVDENVFAYSNRHGDQRAIILYNNRYGSTHGTIQMSVGFLEKETGSLRQKSLADGLGLPDDESTILAYRDTVVGLEYLRRARAFREHGLSLDLRGYQHVVLLDWRELWPSATQPWDRLCDVLNGSGVYSLDEALFQLRLRPLVDALHQAISGANVHAFSEVASELLARRQEAQEKANRSNLAGANEKQTAEGEIPSEAGNAGENPDPRLSDFIAKVHLFAETTMGLSQLGGTKNDAAPSESASGAAFSTTAATESIGRKEKGYAEMAAASVYLPSLVSAFPKALKTAADSVLPSSNPSIAPSEVWAPLLAWIALRALPTPAAALAVYDELQLRHALAETFSAVGLKGEQAWRAAAQVRVLLRTNVEATSLVAIRSEEFWHDPDVRWLAGINSTVEKEEYFNQECFEALVCWLQLPALIGVAEDRSFPAKAANDVAAMATNLTRLAKRASYNVRIFLDLLSAGNTKDESDPSAESATTLSEGQTV
jgi:hypothetical protein